MKEIKINKIDCHFCKDGKIDIFDKEDKFMRFWTADCPICESKGYLNKIDTINIDDT